MKILTLILLFAPSLFAQATYRKQVNPNDEPFLPINPMYPYKRSTDKEAAPSYSVDLYTPRPDARDSFAASFARNPEKNPFFSGYGGFPAGFPRNPVPPYAPYSPYYENSLFGIYSSPYVGNPYASGVHGYFNEPPYFYPDYYNQGYNPYHPYPPPPEFDGSKRPSNNKKSSLNGDYNRVSMETKKNKPKAVDPKPEEMRGSSSNGWQEETPSETGNRYVDGNNLISENQKDAMSIGQRSLSASAFNDRNQVMDFHLHNAQLPPPSYKVISVGGQPVGPNYPLPESYARAKLMEQVAAVQNLVKSLNKALPDRQMNSAQDFQSAMTSSYLPQTDVKSSEENAMEISGKEESFYPEEQNNPSGNINDGREYFQIQMPRAPAPGQTTDIHFYGNEERDLPSEEPAPSDRFISGGEAVDDEQRGSEKIPMEPEDGMSEGERNVEQLFVQSPAMLAKNVGLQRYQNLSYTPKQATSTTPDRSQMKFIPRKNVRPVIEETPEDLPNQSSTSISIPYRSEQNYDRPTRIHLVGNSYQNENAPLAFTYHRMNSHPLPRGSQQQRAPITDLDDVNYGTNQGNKE